MWTRKDRSWLISQLHGQPWEAMLKWGDGGVQAKLEDQQKGCI